MNIFRAISNLFRFDRTNWKALTLCFFAAGIFWLFAAFNKTHSTNVRFPLKFEYDETQYVPVEPLPRFLTLNVTGNGWELFRKSLGVKVPVIFMPLERPWETRKIAASALAPLVAGQVGTLHLNFIVSDTLRIQIEPRVTRKIKLVANLDGVAFKRNFGKMGPVVITPDSVQLEGPRSRVEGLPDSIVLDVAGSRVSENFHESVEVIIANGEPISRNPPVADVHFEVGPVEEIARPVRLNLQKLPWGTDSDMDSVVCVFVVALDHHERFLADAGIMTAQVALGEIRKGEVRSYYPKITGVPAYAKLIHVDSVKVKKY